MNVNDLARGVAGFGLAGREMSGHGGSVTSEPLREGTWRRLRRLVSEQRLTGLLLAAVEAEGFTVTDAQRVELLDDHTRWSMVVLRLERRLLEVVSELERRGIDVLVLKGTAVAHLDYPDSSWRLFGDNDLLVRSEQFDDAVDLLTGSEYRRQIAEARPGFERRFGKGATLIGEFGDELDLHRNLVFGTFGFAIDLDELFDSATTFELGGRSLRALGPETRLFHACYHAALGDPMPRFSSVRDVAEMLLSDKADTRRVLELARRWQMRAVLARAIMLCRDHLGVELDGPVVTTVDDYQPTARERRAIASYVGPNRHFAAKVVASLPYIDGFRAKAAFLSAVAAPEPDFARSHGDEPGVPWIRRGVRSLIRGQKR